VVIKSTRYNRRRYKTKTLRQHGGNEMKKLFFALSFFILMISFAVPAFADCQNCDEVNTEGNAWINTDQYQEWVTETITCNHVTTTGSGVQNITAYGLGNGTTTVEFEGQITQYDLYNQTVPMPLGEANHTGDSIQSAYVKATSSPNCPEISADVLNEKNFVTSTKMTDTTMTSAACSAASTNIDLKGAPGTVNYEVLNEQVNNYALTRNDGAYQTGFTRTCITASNITP